MDTFHHFSTIIDHLLLEDYWKYYFQMPFQLDYGEWIDDEKTLMITCGATRSCIIDSNYDWVVKFSINSNDADACDREVKYYDAATHENLNDCLVECKFIGVYRKKIKYFDFYDLCAVTPNLDNDEWIEEAASQFDMKDIVIEIPLYAYKKVKDACIPWNLSKEDYDLGYNLNSPIAHSFVGVAVALWKNWGEKLFWKFDTFCRKYKIDDLHSGNIGEVDGHLVILDYAGYKG